jgi:hypothetical protein
LAVEILALHLDGTCLWRHIDHMTIIDKQRIAAVRTLEAKGCVFNDPAASKAMPYTRSSSCGLMNSSAAPKARLRRQKLEAIADAIEGYEAIRWPDGKVPGRKGQL